MKQITSTTTFLPILPEECESSLSEGLVPICRSKLTIVGTFTLLAYTNESGDVAVPSTWGDADPHLIDRGKVESVRLRSFSTNVHSLEVSPECLLPSEGVAYVNQAMVAYRVGE
jgi:mitotic spindle assembly checkpoint protein MAD2